MPLAVLVDADHGQAGQFDDEVVLELLDPVVRLFGGLVVVVADDDEF